MIDINKQREKCAMLEDLSSVSMDQRSYIQLTSAALPSLIREHLAALDEIEQLRSENAAIGSDLSRALREGPR